MNNKKNLLRIRAFAVLLSFVLSVTMMPAFAFAETAADDAEAAETTEEVSEELGLYLPGQSLAESDDLLTEYIEKQAGVSVAGPAEETAGSSDSSVAKRKAKLAVRRSILNGAEQQLYDKLKASISKVAAGQTDDVSFSYAMSEADYSKCAFHTVIDTLTTDLAYELYWYDKTTGVLCGYQNGCAVAYFSVSKDYRSTAAPAYKSYSGKDENGNTVTKQFPVYRTDLSRTRAASSAVTNAKKIVSECAGLSDLEKLKSYSKRICALTGYNDDVSLKDDYGDPWQLIYVFDGDPDTNVVCEGYAKAFQLLCDLTGFDNIQSHIAGGTLTGQSKTEPHMWNIVQMDDGCNYLADITNCDSNTIGYPNLLFLAGCESGSYKTGYVYTCSGSRRCTYKYDSDTLRLYSAAELTMAGQDYSPDGVKSVHYPARAATCTAAGCIEHWVKNGVYYRDCNCTQKTTKAGTATKALGHSWGGWKTVRAATCTAAGTQQHQCTRCGKTETMTASALGHSWKTAETLDTTVHTCTRCSSSYTVSKVIVDLPGVTIKKPGRAKKSVTVKWKKVSKKNRKKIGGIEIQYSTNRNFTESASKVLTAGKSRTSKKITNRPRKTRYYVRVRAYKWINGKKHVSAWSSVKSVRTK